MSDQTTTEKRLLRKVLKTKPKTAQKLAWELGKPSYHAITRELGRLSHERLIYKTEYGYLRKTM